MRPFAEVVLNAPDRVFEPALSLTYASAFSIEHYLGVAHELLQMCAQLAGVSEEESSKIIILGLKDMAGMCPAFFMTDLISALRKKWPNLVLHYHRHFTDGHFIPSCAAAAKAGTHIIDTSIAAATRWYGQGEVLSTAAYIEEIGLKTSLDKEMIRKCNFVLKQVIPYYDRYTTPYFQGIDFDVRQHGMPGGATSSSQEGALKQGYIKLLPYMLRFLAGTRKIIFYHDVTPGSQITWNTAFLGVTSAFKRGGEEAVQSLLEVLEAVADKDETQLSDKLKQDRLGIYRDCNDAFRDLLLGKFGKLPLGFPPEWVYRSAFQNDWKNALARRTDKSPLENLEDVDFASEHMNLKNLIHREPTDDEFLMYLNHPGDAVKTIDFKQKFGDQNNLPLDVWFEGLEAGMEISFNDSNGKPHNFHLLSIGRVDEQGVSVVRYVLDSEFMSYEVKVSQGSAAVASKLVMADPANPFHIASPSNGDLWVMYVKVGDIVKKGQELFNISIMKQEKAVVAPKDAQVSRILKTADYKTNKKMVPVREGELLVELSAVPVLCANAECRKPLSSGDFSFCPFCGEKLEIR
jgi:pyruvate carboxylase